MKGFIKTKKIISIVLMFLLFLGNFTYGQANHWAYKNYENIKEKIRFTGEINDFDRSITFSEFKEIFESVTGIIVNNGENVTDVNSELTRKDIIKLLAETLNFEEIIDISIDSYDDYNQIDENMKNAVNKLLSLGIISGYSDNTLRINNKLSLGEAITLIKRANELRIINSIDTATVNLSKEELEMGSLSKATNNAVYMFVYATLLTEELLNTEYHEDIIDDWVEKRDEAIEAWDIVYRNSLIMNYSADLYIQDLENRINDYLSGSNDKNFEWAKKLQEQFDAIKGGNKLKQLSEQLGMDAREAYEALTLSHEIIHGNALKEENFYRYAEIIAKATKTASKVGLLIGATVASGGAATGYVSLTEGAGLFVSGVDAIIDVYSTGSNIILGENAAATIAFNKLEDDFAPVSSIFGLAGFNSSAGADKLFFIGEELTDFVFDGELIGINVTDDPIGGSISYFKIPLENGKFPDDLSNFELLNLMEYNALKDITHDISDYAFDLKTDDNDDYKDILDMLGKELEEIEKSTTELIEEIEEKEDKPIEEILEETEEKIKENEQDDIKEEKDDNKDEDKEDDEDEEDDSDDVEDPEDTEDPEDQDDPEESGDPEDPEDPEEPEEPGEPEEPVYYTLTIYYEIVGEDDGSANLPDTFVKKYKYGEEYNNPVMKIDGYTADRESVAGTMVNDVSVTVYYFKDYDPSIYITYVIADGKVDAPNDYVDSYKVGESFSVLSPTIDGYYPDIPIVEGVMTEEGYYQTVTYYNNDKYYTVTIRYVFVDESGNETEALETENRDVKVGDSYTITPPIIEGYYADTDEFTRTMGDVGNINYTIKYRPNPEGPEEISGVKNYDSVMVPEGTPINTIIESYLPEEIEAYIKAGNETIEVSVNWNEDTDSPMPTKNEVWNKYFYTGGYTFKGEFSLPATITNPWGFKPDISVEFHPIDYPNYRREVTSDGDMYTVLYEDEDGIQGPWERYYEDTGILYEMYNYKDGLYHGVHEEYQGPDNSISKRTNYSNGKLEGPYETWYTHNGEKEFIGQFTNDMQTGEWEEYDENGKLFSKGSYLEGSKDGEWEYYYENGQIEIKCSYNEGNKHGEWKEYYSDGKIHVKGNYENGIAVGTWYYYDTNGNETSVEMN